MKVRGTQETVEPVEVAKTTVYVRTNIKRIDTTEFNGWEYDEEQIPVNEFIAGLQKSNTALQKNNIELQKRLELSESAIDFIIMNGGVL